MLTKLTRSTAKKAAAKEVPYVLKDKYLQVTVGGKPFTLDSTHPTFNRMKKALQSKNWKAVPKLVTLAQSLVSASQGNVTVKNGVVFYKGTAIEDVLTRRIVDMVKGKKNVQFMMMFMDNLYKNPDPEAIRDFGGWLLNNDLPITDDGCFIAYKSVDGNLKDQHTHKIDNSPGQTIMMPRAAADTNYRTQCSYGFHVCSKQYGLYGSRIMAVKINPRDVIAANSGKMRVLKYEVLYELGLKDNLSFTEEGFSQLEKQVVVEIKAERKELLKMVLANAQVKRLIKNQKLSEASLKKAAYARLKSIAQRYEIVPQPQTEAQELLPPLEGARKAAGLSVGQVAKASGLSYKVVAKLEKEIEPHPSKSDAVLTAIGTLKLGSMASIKHSAISFPVATAR